MERKALLNRWLRDRLEGKGLQRQDDGTYTLTAREIVQSAQFEAQTYIQIANERPNWLTSVESLIDEMRRNVTDSVSGLRGESVVIVNDAGNALTSAEDDAMSAALEHIADETERTIRNNTMSLFDRIGPPKGDRRRTYAKAEQPAPGAHRHYK